MKEILKWIAWVLFFVAVQELVERHTMPKDEKYEASLQASLSKINEKSSTLFFLGSSRIMKSVNPKVLNDSLSGWETINFGMSGNSLAQNLFFAQFLSKMPGKKVLFIELTKFKSEMPISFTYTAKVLGFPDFPFSYYQYIHVNQDFRTKFENTEKVFWDWITKQQMGVKGLISGEIDQSYKIIGYTPIYESNYPHHDSFITRQDLVTYSKGKVDIEIWNRIEEIIKLQVKGNLKVVFLMPLNYKSKDELALQIPIYSTLPSSLKWEYDDLFLKEIKKANYLEDRNHLNYQGSLIYSQGLVNYIKANEKNWQ
ncbi:hypothetical protein [Aquirufa salirivi]|uniref:DUF1574 domain-containing protein n=1 Tax=Aquirufa salirivi TaxID=3104729 RepID=A0ABW8RXM9_9BACT